MKPTLQQIQASDPQQSVWVSASAGTGKTRVLVNRLLRLLLAGNKPEKLLCITFTKAAAAEVLQRIQEAVLTWSICDDTKLRAELEDLLDRPPQTSEIRHAKRLLPVILQVPGGMKIMTIHAFCQSVLARFPLEANITPGFSVIDESESQNLLDQAKYHLLETTTLENDPALFADLERFFDRVFEGNQNTLIQNVLGKRYRLAALPENMTQIKDVLCRVIGIDITTIDTISEETFFAQRNDTTLYACLPPMFGADGKTLPKVAAELQRALENKSISFDNYKSVYLTQSHTINSNLQKGLAKLDAATEQTIIREAERCITFIEMLQKADLVKDTMALLHICIRIMAVYQRLKKENGVLDYEDQILMTAELLKNPLDSQWVHYKLDGGIDHILVDEAQDTSPAQWAIIRGITEEFFSGTTRTEKGERTLFVVGDEKQSIFSFQNADPEEFARSRTFFDEKTTANDIKWHDLSLIDNFRSAPLILKLTDQVFHDPAMAEHISKTGHAVTHSAFHATRAGSVSIWPQVPSPPEAERTYHNNPVIVLSNKIADHVETLLQKTRPLLSNGNVIQPGDIMILVRKRDPMVAPLTKAFKDRGIGVSSSDRMVLSEQLAVQDCLSAIQVGLNPHDDYTLACFLKSPFIGMTEETLFTLRMQDTTSLWHALQQGDHHAIVAYIHRLAHEAKTTLPGVFMHLLLSHPCPANARSGRHAVITRLGYDADDVLNELLSSAYGFSDQCNATCQAFLTWLNNNTTTIKQGHSETDKSRVQIMTAHAAKGLQAAYVFLADAHSKPESFKSVREVLWLDDPAHGFVWGTGRALKADFFEQQKQHYIAKQFSEYYRLLYVALTRAEEHLIICGIEKKETHKDFISWYEASKQAAEALGHNTETYHCQTNKDGTMTLEQRGAAPEAKERKAPAATVGALPDALLAMPEPEPTIIRPLRPSRPQEDDLPVFSPLQTIRHDPYKRGKILHNLFRILPDYPREEQESVLDNMLKHLVPAEKERNQIRGEVLRVLRHDAFGDVFSPKARAEVPVVGEVMIDGTPFAISGQIDRLLVEDDRVLIIDYKTNRPPQMDEALVPAAYKHQMRAYKILMEKIYPGKRVETALLWTSIAQLLKLSV